MIDYLIKFIGMVYPFILVFSIVVVPIVVLLSVYIKNKKNK